MSLGDRSLRGTINAADLSVSKEEYNRAENALLEALSEVRKRKSKGGTHGDD